MFAWGNKTEENNKSKLFVITLEKAEITSRIFIWILVS